MLGSEPTGGQVAVVRDYDFHPLDDLRLFPMPEPGVPRLDGRAFVAVVRYGDIVVWHDTFADHWFKVNVTTDLDGAFVETTPKGRRSRSPSTATSPPQWCAGRRGLGRRAVP